MRPSQHPGQGGKKRALAFRSRAREGKFAACSDGLDRTEISRWAPAQAQALFLFASLPEATAPLSKLRWRAM